MRMLAGTFALALLALTPFNASTAGPLTPVSGSNVGAAVATLCDEQGALACKATCPFDTVENYEACAYACEVFHGCA